MTLSKVVTSVGQIDVKKVKAHPCEYFGVVGCILAPLGKLQSPVQYLTPLPLTSGGKTAGCNGARFDVFFCNCIYTVTANVNCGEILHDLKIQQYQRKLHCKNGVGALAPGGPCCPRSLW